MKKINKNIIGINLILILGILILTSFVSAYTLSSYSSEYNNAIGIGMFSGSQSLKVDESMCQQGTDFIIQIAPLSCTPTPVRSDLLEEENVNVFCQLTATQINPFVDVKAIDWLTFSGQTPREVLGLGYFPAQSALGYTANTGLEGSALLNNLGYVAITLKRQPNESALTNCEKGALGSEVCWVEGNLTAKLRYDIENAFGVGQAVFYIPVMDDEEWQQNYKQYGFWQGRGYLRAEAVGNDDATISVYADSSVAGSLSNKNREYNLATYNSNINLKTGDSSGKIFLPGLSSCLASLKLTLNGIENPDTRATIKINEDYVRVAEGEKFLENKCILSSIDKKGVSSSVKLRCQEDGKSSSFDLRIFPEINLSINGITKPYKVGDWLYKSEDGEKSVYLGYVGTKGDSTNEADLFAYLVSLPVHENTLTDSEISSVVTHAESMRSTSKTGAKAFDGLVNALNKVSGTVMQVGKWAIRGESFNIVYYGEKVDSAKKIDGSSVLLKGFANAKENSDNPGYMANYNNAMADFETVINNFPTEVEKDNSLQPLGEKSLYEQIYLANSIGKKQTVVSLCKKYEEDYPNSYVNIEICLNSLELSSSEKASRDVLINGITRSVSLEGINEPSVNDYSATLIVQGTNGETNSYVLRKNEEVVLSGLRSNADSEKLQSTETVMLTDLGTDTASIKLNLGDKSFFKEQFVSNTYSFKKGISQRPSNSPYTFTLINVNLKKVAKISVNPSTDFAESNTTFKFKVGIEKRNTLLKLSPEKTQEKINSLNSSIADWKKASDTLGTVVKTMKGACLGAGAVLTFKNLIDNYGGKSIARNQIMNGADGKGGGWNDKCAAAVSANPPQYKSMDDCFIKNSDSIDNQVNTLSNLMNSQNQEIKQVEKENMQGASSTQVNTVGFAKSYSEKVMATLNSLSPEKKQNLKMGDIATTITPDGWEKNKYTIEQLKEIELYTLYLQSGTDDVTATQRLNSVLADINNNAKTYVQVATRAGEMGIGSDKVTWIEISKNVQKYPYEGLTIGNTKKTNLPSTFSSETPIAVVQTEQGTYTLVLDNSVGSKIYSVKRISQTWQIYDSAGVLVTEKQTIDRLSSSVFQVIDATSYNNKYKSSFGSSSILLRYYEDSPYKGLPSVVPFDTASGWYTGIKTPQTSYDASGRVVSFWICNVGANGIEEFQLEGFGDDICELFNTNTGQKYTQFPGLSETKTSSLVTSANNAIQAAQRAYKQGVNSVTINSDAKNIKVGTPAVTTLAVQCTDFMSPKDCSILFNLCDPVICPSSRCNLGGNYPVQNVIQSGIIGSLALCYPNAKWNGGDVYIPICLSGVQAGMDSWISIQNSYKDCLQTSLSTGETVGICDEIRSVYTCEFFWKQALPIIKTGIPKLLSALTGQNKKGGGEYQGITSALSTAQSSIDYFKQYYAANSYRAFQVRSTEQVGTDLCSKFVSLTYPNGGSFLDNLIQPDSPFQFTGKFDEIPLTTLTNPPTSQYKVYYHIYAGKDSGAYYKVYLRGSGSSYYQDTSQSRIVDSGYIPKGEYKSNTVDFTSPSGYKELCIVVNGQEECGFKEASTSFAVNYVNDLYIAEQSTTNVTTETECISGTSSLYSLLNLNVENAANNLINPALYTQGIIRICSTSDPGVGTDINAGTQNARWKKMGYCGDAKVGCWIDTDSVKNVIKTMNVEQNTLDKISSNTLQYLSKDYLSIADFGIKIAEIQKETNDANRIELINLILNKVFLNNQKAQLFFWRGKSYSNLVVNSLKIEEFPCRHFCGIDGNVYYGIPNPDTGICEKSNLVQKNCLKGCNYTYGICVEDLSLVDSNGNIIGPAAVDNALNSFNTKYMSPIVIFEDGKITSNFCYRYFNSVWQWSVSCSSSSSIKWNDVGSLITDISSGKVNNPSDKNKEFILSLKSQDGNYIDGLKLLVDRTLAANEGGISKPDLTDKDGITNMDKDGMFTVKFSNANYESMKKLYFKYDNMGWYWEISNSFEGGGIWQPVSNVAPGFNEEQKNIVIMLKDKDFIQGAAILFDPTSEDIKELYGVGTGTSTTSSLEDTFAKRDLTKLTTLMTSLSNSVSTSSLKCYCGNNCGDYAKWIMDASQAEYVSGKQNIPDELLLLAIMIQETSCKSIESSGGDMGLMQINAKVHCGTNGLPSDITTCKSTLLNNNEKNIDVGAQILRSAYSSSSRIFSCGIVDETYSKWEYALRGYNGWGCTGDNNYVEDVKAKYFELVDLYNGVPATTIPSNNQVCTPPVISPDVLKLSDTRQRVLKAAEELEGTLAYIGPSSCYSATMFVYQSAGVTFKCDYSDKSGKEYFLTAENDKKVTIGVDKNEGGAVLYVPNVNSCTYSDWGFSQKINDIQPGDELDIVWNSGAGHSVIFIGWVDETQGYAKVFDWMGGTLAKGQLDDKGNPCDDAHIFNKQCKKYAYHNIYLTDTTHPIYLYRIPYEIY
jgi:hypothetical protein